MRQDVWYGLLYQCWVWTTSLEKANNVIQLGHKSGLRCQVENVHLVIRVGLEVRRQFIVVGWVFLQELNHVNVVHEVTRSVGRVAAKKRVGYVVHVKSALKNTHCVQRGLVTKQNSLWTALHYVVIA